MLSGPFGVMVHWLAPGPMPEQGPRLTDLDAAVDRFDVDRFMSDLVATGGKWLIFTFGQNKGMYCSPNSVFERYCGAGVCSRRDLALEIAQKCQAPGIRFIGYMPCEVNANGRMHAGMAWNTQPGTDQAEFQQRYTLALAEWGERFGKLMAGWWFDGCYTWPVFHNSKMNWPLWYERTRAGNPDRALAFNDGGFISGRAHPIQPEHDYLSGEIEALRNGQIVLGRVPGCPVHVPTSRFAEGTRCQWHGLLPIDCFWGHGTYTASFHEKVKEHALPFRIVPDGYAGPMEEPVYSDQELSDLLKRIRSAGGVMTFNVGIYQEGHLGPKSVAQLGQLASIMEGEQSR